MSVITNAIALLNALRPEDIQALPPFERRRFSDLLNYWARIADKPDAPKSGVLGDLHQNRAH